MDGIDYALSKDPATPCSAGFCPWPARRSLAPCHSLSVQQLGEAYLLADQWENARACADRTVMLARGRGERAYEAWALRLLGDIASHHGRPEVATAAAHYGAALTLASELEMRPLVAHCHLGLGRLYRRAGDRAKADEHLVSATTMYREMDMAFWLRKAEVAQG
jgi:tetratricopeptide (TPR) repeat protein